MHHHRTLVAHLQPSGIRTAVYQGREHLVVPVVLMVGNIVVEPITGDGRGEFVPGDVLQQAPSQWDGRPVVPGHPPSGSANTPQRLEARQIGTLFNSRFQGGRLVSEAWLDTERAQAVGKNALSVLERLRRGEAVEVSVGAWVTLEDAPGTAGGKQFARRWMHISADHLAMLPEGAEGACSLADGCGAGTSFMAAQARPEIHAAVAAMRHQLEGERVRRRIRTEIAQDYRAITSRPEPAPYTAALQKLGIRHDVPIPRDDSGVPLPYGNLRR